MGQGAPTRSLPDVLSAARPSILTAPPGCRNRPHLESLQARCVSSLLPPSQNQPLPSHTTNTHPSPSYAVLGLKPGVPESDIKATYRKKSLLIHPDKTKNPL